MDATGTKAIATKEKFYATIFHRGHRHVKDRYDEPEGGE
jgi:hypothetical protein